MTTYSYKIVLNDTESIMMKEAMKLMIEHCEEQIRDGPQAPFWAYKRAAEAVKERLHADVTQMSGNNFDQVRIDSPD